MISSHVNHQYFHNFSDKTGFHNLSPHTDASAPYHPRLEGASARDLPPVSITLPGGRAVCYLTLFPINRCDMAAVTSLCEGFYLLMCAAGQLLGCLHGLNISSAH